MKTRSKLIWLELIGGLFGWAWILAWIAALFFLVAAITSRSPWSRLWVAVATGILSKWLASGFMENKARVAFEADLVEKGYSRDDAAKEWIKRYARGQI